MDIKNLKFSAEEIDSLLNKIKNLNNEILNKYLTILNYFNKKIFFNT